MTEEEQLDGECTFTRNLLCGMILQAVYDIKSEKVFKSKQLNEEQELDRNSAIHFIKSKTFRDICNVISLPPDKIITAALKYDIGTRSGDNSHRFYSARPPKDR